MGREREREEGAECQSFRKVEEKKLEFFFKS